MFNHFLLLQWLQSEAFDNDLVLVIMTCLPKSMRMICLHQSATLRRHRVGRRHLVGVAGRPEPSGRSAGTNEQEALQRPLVSESMQQWGKGDLSARQVEKIVTASAGQGATGLPKLASPNNPQNLQSSLLAAFERRRGRLEKGERFSHEEERSRHERRVR